MERCSLRGSTGLGRARLRLRRSSTSPTPPGVSRASFSPRYPLLIPQFATANHKAIFANVGCTTVDYPYYDPKTIGLAFDAYTAFLRAAPPQSVFLLHACAHNPTGVDPTREQWKEVCQIFLEKGHYAFFDCA